MPIKITVRYLSKLPLLEVTKSNKDSVTSIDKSFDYDSSIHLDNDYQSEFMERLCNLKYDHRLVNSLDLFKLFKFYLKNYIEKKISIQYLVYLILNRTKIDKTSLLENEHILKMIYNDDYCYFKRILEFKLSQDAKKCLLAENIRFLNDDFKNGFVVRSTEVLNDLNINHLKKFNKFENVDLKVFFKLSLSLNKN